MMLNWFRRKKLEDGLDRELRYHLERRSQDLQQSGVPAKEAERQAKLELGGVVHVQEEVRDVWLTRWLRDFAYDLRFSIRSYLRTPSFTITVVLSLMLGIGATTAIYSLVDQVLLHALPVRQPERLVLIDWKGDQAASGFGTWNLMSYPFAGILTNKSSSSMVYSAARSRTSIFQPAATTGPRPRRSFQATTFLCSGYSRRSVRFLRMMTTAGRTQIPWL